MYNTVLFIVDTMLYDRSLEFIHLAKLQLYTCGCSSSLCYTAPFRGSIEEWLLQVMENIKNCNLDSVLSPDVLPLRTPLVMKDLNRADMKPNVPAQDSLISQGRY